MKSRLRESTRIGRSLLQALLQRGQRSVAVLGLAKNVGKTIVTGTLLRELAYREMPCAVLSLGRDGERFDALDDRRKPAVHLAPGMLALIRRADLQGLPPCEILNAPGIESAAGELVLIRAQMDMQVELYGPRSAQEVKRSIAGLRRYTDGMLLLDGALDRLAGLAGLDIALILATGSTLDRRLTKIAERTAALFARLTLKPATLEGLFEPEGVLDELEAARILARESPQGIVLKDPLAVTPEAFRALRAQKIELYSRVSYPVIACSTNAVARSWSHDPLELAERIHEATECMTVDCFRDILLV